MLHAVECRKKRGGVWALRHSAALASNPACWQRLVRSADCPPEAGMGATHVEEVADGIYRINTAVEIPDGAFSFNQYLIADDEPLLFHSGPRRLFPSVRDAVARVVPLERLRFVGFSHYESDECGALNDFLAAAPRAEPVCGRINALVNGDSFDRPARALADGEELPLGRHRVRRLDMPHLPHAWECGYLFEVRSRTLLCGDLFTQPGDGARPLVTSTQSDLNPRPVFQSQARDPAELALVVRNENQLLPERLRRDQCVERTDGFARALQLCAQVCIRRGIARGELEDGQRPEEILHEAHRLQGRRALCRARAQLRLRANADRDVRAAPREHPLQHRRVLLQCVDAGIRIEQVLQSSFSRSSGSPCGGLVKSSGAPAKVRASAYPSGTPP